MKIICLISFLLFPYLSFAQVTPHHIEVTSGYAIDIKSNWNVAAARQARFKPFAEGQNVNIGYNKFGTVWCYLKIKNTQAQTIKTWLCFNNYHIDSLTLHDRHRTVLIGDRTANQNPFIKALAFEVQLKPGEERELFVRLKKQTSFVEFSYTFENLNAIEFASSRTTALIAFFIGITFLLLMINSILFITTKEKLYSYYIAYSVLTVIYAAVTTNFAKHILLPDFLFFSEIRVFSGALWYIALTYFLSYFLKLSEHQVLKHRIIKILCQLNILLIMLAILLLIAFPDFDFRYLFSLSYITLMAALVLLFWATIVHLKVEKRHAIYVLFAFVPQFIWAASIILKALQLIPEAMGSNWLLFASLYEVLLFGYVLSRNYIAVFIKNSELMKQSMLEKERSLKAITEVQLRERRNIANIIHDNLGSKIAHVIHLFDLSQDKLAKATIVEMADEIREISHKILPKALDEGALVSSLQSRITNLNTGLNHPEIELFCYDFPDKIDEKWVFDLYLISLEIINNAIKHGKAKSITIEFYKYTNNYHFQFIDDGEGFNVIETGKGFGLDSMEKRIHFYKGSLEINSAKNEGTVIQIDIPF